MKATLVNIEYWFDGMTSAMQVTKSEYYDFYNSGYSGFCVYRFSDGTYKVYNKR